MAAALLACVSCVDVDNGLGGGLLPVNHTYTVIDPDPVDIGVDVRMADSLSGYSSTRITIGAIRNDDEYGLTTRASVVTLIPLADTVDFGSNPVYRNFHFSAILDSTSVDRLDQKNIIQNVNVYEMEEPLSDGQAYCNSEVSHGKRVSNTIPTINGDDSLSFNFTREFGRKYMGMTMADLADYDTYLKHFPGIYINTDAPLGQGGRINIYQLQLGYSNGYGITGSYAELSWTGTYKGERKDTSMFFYFSATGFYDLDSLMNNSGTGSFPQYCLDLTGHESRARAGKAGEMIYVEGGGGLKPVVSAKEIRDAMRDIISSDGHDPSKAVVNRATLNFHFEPSDPEFELMYKVPEILSPTCRIVTDSTVSFMGLSDASSSVENQGDINRSWFTYNPDITYHAQKLLLMEDDNEFLANGSYDIWLLIMHNDIITTTSSGNSDISQYYQYLAYQSYMNNMYGGYGGYGYGGYGYGYGSSYSNYYNYAMMAQYYGSSSTSTSSKSQLDRDRYYYCRLYGPEASDESLRPQLSFTYSVPND